MIRLRPMLVLCAVLALTLGVATASAGDGNNQKQLCKEGGWQNWARADYTTFQNKHECYSYVKHGGTLGPLTNASQLLCESYGGTFGADNQTSGSGGSVFWTCNGNGVTGAAFTPLVADCQADLGSLFKSAVWNLTGTEGVSAFTCFRA